MVVLSGADVTFNGNSNVLKSNTAPGNKGKSIYSQSSNLEFSVCKPGTKSPGALSGHLELDYDGCPIELCSWHLTNQGVVEGTTGTHLVPVVGCKMSKMITVYGDMTINGEIDSYRELQSNRVDNQNVEASGDHRHFGLYSPGKLTLNYLKLTWGEAGSTANGGSVYMLGGTLGITFVIFDGSKIRSTSGHAAYGGAIYAMHPAHEASNKIQKKCLLDNRPCTWNRWSWLANECFFRYWPEANAQSGGGAVTAFCNKYTAEEITIRDSTFQGWGALYNGGAIGVKSTVNPMTITSTTFKNNWAGVSLSISRIFNIFAILNQLLYVLTNIYTILFLLNLVLFSLHTFLFVTEWRWCYVFSY
jgi:hypothetical protein